MISIRAYAESRGISHTAVQKAIKSGRLVKCLGRSASGAVKIADPDMADREWAANTDQSKPLNVISGEPKRRAGADASAFEPRQNGGMPAKRQPAREIKNPGVGADYGAESGPSETGGGPSYAKSRAIREAYQARLAKLEYEEKAAKLVSADEARVAIFNTARRARDMLVAVPDRVAPLVVGQDDAHEIHRILMDEMRRIAAEIAKIKLPGVEA